MDWILISNLVVKEGLPLAEALFVLWQSKNDPTAEDFANLRKIASMTAADKMKEALTRAGIDLDSDEAKALVAQTLS